MRQWFHKQENHTLDEEQAAKLGNHLTHAREAVGMTKMGLGEQVGLADSTIYRIEQGQIAEPRPDKLKRICEALGLSTADVFAMAGYSAPTDLPNLQPYLRTKYKDLPPDAMEEILKHASKVAKRHGISMTGPAPGEDES